MSGTARPFHYGRNSAEIECAGIRLRIHFFCRRSEYIVTTGRFQQSTVFIQRTRIRFKVVLVVKLGRIDKNTDYTHVIFFHTTFNQAQVSVMQCSHSGNKANLFVITLFFSEITLQFFNAVYYFHPLDAY